MPPFLNPTIEVVTFRLRGWCILGVFLLPAFIHLGHECQDLLSLCDGMHVCRLDLGLYSHPKEVGFFWNGVRTHVNSKGKIPSTWKNSPQRRIEPTTLHQAGQRAQYTTNELFRSPTLHHLTDLPSSCDLFCFGMNTLCDLNVIRLNTSFFCYDVWSVHTKPVLILVLTYLCPSLPVDLSIGPTSAPCHRTLFRLL